MVKVVTYNTLIFSIKLVQREYYFVLIDWVMDDLRLIKIRG